MARSYLHTVDSVDFQIAGFGFLDVASMSMTLEPGCFPMATVGVALAGGGRTGTHGNNTTVNAHTLGELNRRLNMLIELAAESRRCNLSMKLTTTRMTDGKTGTQSIELRNWILVAAGIGSVTTTNSFSVQCTIAHPAYRLAMHGGFCTNFNERLHLESLADKVKDPVSAGVLVYGRIKEIQNELHFKDSGGIVRPGGKSPTAIMDEVKGVFDSIPDLIGESLEWSPALGGGSTGIPFKDLLTAKLRKAVQQLMLETWMPVGANSVWDIFMQCVCPEFDLTVVPDYTKEKLPVCPFYPWMTSTMELNEDDLFEMAFPGVDPAPIYGVCASPQMEMINDQFPSTYAREKAENLSDKANVLAFVPEANADINGKFFSGALPEWLCSAIQLAPGEGKQDVESSTYDGSIPQESPKAGDNPEMKSANSLKMSCLAYTFLKSFKKRLEATINCPLLFSRNGEDPFLPGGVLSVNNSSGTLIRGMVVSMTHSIDMGSGMGSTSMHLAFCQPADGYPVLKEVMDKNPMYS